MLKRYEIIFTFQIHDRSKTTSDGHNCGGIDEEFGILSPSFDCDLWLRLHSLHRILMTDTYSRINKGLQQLKDKGTALCG
jgi:hypothetical protein